MKHFWNAIYCVGISLVILFLLRQLNNRWGFFTSEPRHTVTLFRETEIPTFEATASAGAITDSALLLDSLSAEAVFVTEITSNTVLLEKNPQLPLPPASVTKLMTVFTALKHFSLNDPVFVSTQSALQNDGGGFLPLEKVKVKDLAAASLVQSANDAAWALADAYPGGVPAFVEQMNLDAQSLHLWSTRFENPVGYDHPDTISTAHDLAVLTARVFQEPPIAEWMSLSSYVIENETGRVQHFLFSTNELLEKEPGVIGGKTGTTPLAKEVLVTIADINGHRYCIVVMGSESRYVDTQMLLQWVRENIVWKEQEFPLQIPVKTR